MNKTASKMERQNMKLIHKFERVNSKMNTEKMMLRIRNTHDNHNYKVIVEKKTINKFSPK